MTLMPRARPRSLGGNTAVTIAAAVANIRALPTPWTMRLPMSQAPLMLSAASREPSVKTTMPSR